jgi:abortive infection bacteriophage resistance protein
VNQPVRVYAKPAKTPKELLSHLESRSLVITDRAACLHALRHVGYYRLLIYMRPLQTEPGKVFKQGTVFEDVLALYNFDRELRLLCMDAIEKIEVALRAAIINTLAVEHGPHFHADASNFTKLTDYSDFLRTAISAKYLAIKHYADSYDSPQIAPVWAIAEAITFGMLSRLYSSLTLSNRKLVARQFGYDEEVLVSWFRTLNTLRNMCAHHNRLWNASLAVDMPKIAKALKSLFKDNKSFHARAVVLVALLAVIDPQSTWTRQLRELLDRYPSVNPTVMGFPVGWRDNPFWA